MIILVTTILKNKQGEILVLKRSDKNKHYSNYWQLPEGKIEDNESPTSAMYRELWEEIKTKPNNLELKYVISSEFKKMWIKIPIVRIVFESNENAKITLSQDHSEYNWLKSNKVLKLSLVPGTDGVINKYI